MLTGSRRWNFSGDKTEKLIGVKKISSIYVFYKFFAVTRYFCFYLCTKFRPGLTSHTIRELVYIYPVQMRRESVANTGWVCVKHTKIKRNSGIEIERLLLRNNFRTSEYQRASCFFFSLKLTLGFFILFLLQWTFSWLKKSFFQVWFFTSTHRFIFFFYFWFCKWTSFPSLAATVSKIAGISFSKAEQKI